jgi:rhamnose transport system ATP-binding protein
VTPPRLALDAISKSFGGIAALRNVSFAVEPGSVHALLGENGAGKSTIVKIVSGIHRADGGRVLFDGAPFEPASPLQARRQGLVAVYQDPKLFPHLDVAENIFMGAFPKSAGLIRHGDLYRSAGRLLDMLGIDLDPRQAVMGLSIGEAQFVEFARAMAVGDIRLLFLDEPTAALSPGETRRLFDFVRQQQALGTSVVFISHRLEDLRGLVDRVTILRDGRHILTTEADGISETEIVRAMVGRDVAIGRVARPARPAGAERLRVEGLTVPGLVSNVDLALRAGEIVGMSGLVGAGRSEVAMAIMGLIPAGAGRVWVDGTEVPKRTPRIMRDAGVAYVPEDRDHTGLVPSHSIRENLTMAILDQLSRRGLLSARRDRARSAGLIGQLRIKVGSMEDAVSTLSGGNRQKVVIGKWLATSPRVFILDEPTHGIDVGTKAHVHSLIRDLAGQGAAVLVISSDLPEVLALSDRIVVMRHGRIAAELDGDGADEHRVMAAATGVEAVA